MIANDPVVAVDDDDLIANDEVHVPAPLGMDFDERRGNLYHPDASWHRGADADGEVDVVNPRHIPAGQDHLSDLSPIRPLAFQERWVGRHRGASAGWRSACLIDC